MNRYILEEFHNDPALLHRLFGEARREARRERARAVRAGLAWLRKRLTLRLRLHAPRWTERLG